MERLFRSAVVAAALAQSTLAGAWDGMKVGKITQIDTTCCTNFDFRIYLDGPGNMCSGTSENWAYMNTSWGNYQATASLLMSAWMAAKPVRIHTYNVNGYCQIGYVVVT